MCRGAEHRFEGLGDPGCKESLQRLDIGLVPGRETTRLQQCQVWSLKYLLYCDAGVFFVATNTQNMRSGL